MSEAVGTVSGVDFSRLGAWLTANVPEASGPARVDLLAGGASNLTFRVRDGAHDWVLRRPPVAHVLATAHDMGREFRVQRALADSGVPVARMIAECRDSDIIGAPFYVMEHVDGVIYREADSVADLAADQARAISCELVDVLVRLYSVDPASVGLGDFGRADGFLHRQLSRWRKQWDQSRRRDIPALDELANRLDAAMPRHSPSGLVHGDYGLNNVLFHSADVSRVAAVLDWEMATLGDPLTDVGMLLTYWGPVGDLLWRGRGAKPQNANAGFLAVGEMADRYAQGSGLNVSDLDFYMVLAAYKLAVITAGVYTRRLETDPDAAEATGRLAENLAAAALALADASSVPGLSGPTGSRGRPPRR